MLFDGLLATCFGMVRGGNLKGTLLCRTGVGVVWGYGRRQKLNYSRELCHVWTSGTDTEMKWISTVLISLFCEGWYSCHTHHSVLPPHRQLTVPVQSPPAIYHFPVFIPKILKSLVRCPKVLNLNDSPTDRLFTYWLTFTSLSPTRLYKLADHRNTKWIRFLFYVCISTGIPSQRYRNQRSYIKTFIAVDTNEQAICDC